MYLMKAGSGAGHLASGGSYVTLMNTTSKDFTIIIETMVQCMTNAWQLLGTITHFVVTKCEYTNMLNIIAINKPIHCEL